MMNSISKDKPKNIEQAMAEQKPEHKIVEILSNKFCIAYSKFIDGSFSKEPSYFGLDNGKIYYYPKSLLLYAHKLPNINKVMLCCSKNNSGLKIRWVFKTQDNRKYKKNCRKLQRLLSKTHLTR